MPTERYPEYLKEEPPLPGEPEYGLEGVIAKTLGQEWLLTQNLCFGDRPPRELLGTPDEQRLRDLIRTVMVAGIS